MQNDMAYEPGLGADFSDNDKETSCIPIGRHRGYIQFFTRVPITKGVSQPLIDTTKTEALFMATEGLVEPKKYDIKDSNIELLGSDLEHHVREHGGDKETAWETAGKEPGLQIWRIEKFHVVPWSEDRKGTFYEGDSYIVLNTYKKSSDSDTLAYDLHFWLGKNTTQDEAGTAAYKTVELDDHLHGQPVEYREVQGYESNRFLSYFPRLTILRGGVSTGFHHVTDPPPLETKRLYQITASTHHGSGAIVKTNISIREVPPEVQSLNKGDVFVLDLGAKIIQYNTAGGSGKERFMAASFVRRIADSRPGTCQPTVYDERASGGGTFLSMLGAEEFPQREAVATTSGAPPIPSIFSISDASGTLEFSRVTEPPSLSVLSSSDAFLVDASHFPASPAVYVWIGREASLAESRLSIQYAQKYLHDRQNDPDNASVDPATLIIRIREGSETAPFLEIMQENRV